MRSFWGVPKIDPNDLPQRIRADYVRNLIYLYCYDFPIRPDSPQVRFLTCKELTQMLSSHLNWPPWNATEDQLLSAQRRVRYICRELGVELKDAPVGRPRGAKKNGK
jgi:hypothetical protein